MSLIKHSTVERPDCRGIFDEAELDIAAYLREEADDTDGPRLDLRKQGFIALTIGAVGVVYGDIGTSPLYAFREALRPVVADGLARGEVLGLLSLLIWTLLLIVTVKYVIFLLRADNNGEGGVLALYTLARLASGRRSIPVLALAIAGAALFAGDAMITPAISVLSAVEGAGILFPQLGHWVVPATVGILVALFSVQQRGTAAIAGAFGPITVLWFLVLALLGIWHIADDPGVLASLNPVWAVYFIAEHQIVAFIVLGAVFLAVTGAEALYADLGHFGRKPITIAWLVLIFPALVLNYMGQGALVLSDPTALDNPFFRMAPEPLLPALVALATVATVIAAQAVISGAYSMARAATQLGLCPRMTIHHTSHDQRGQIYIAAVNWALLVAVTYLVVSFETSEALASAYGIAVTGTMIVTTALAVIYISRIGVPLSAAILMALPIGAVELAFLASNLTKITHGGYIPIIVALVAGTAMWAWWRGSQIIRMKIHKRLISLESFARSIAGSVAKGTVDLVPGTAFFLTPDPDVVPSALLHNLKHNHVLHEQTVLLTIETLRVPYAALEERAQWQPLDGQLSRLTLRFGYMETPNVAHAMVHARKAGLKFDVMRSSFFIGRRRPVVTGHRATTRILDRLYALLYRFSADPSDFYHLPRDRVVELGERVAV